MFHLEFLEQKRRSSSRWTQIRMASLMATSGVCPTKTKSGLWGYKIWANYNDLSRGHLKWWFSKGIHPKIPLIPGLGIILICPDKIEKEWTRHHFIKDRNRGVHDLSGRKWWACFFRIPLCFMYSIGTQLLTSKPGDSNQGQWTFEQNMQNKVKLSDINSWSINSTSQQWRYFIYVFYLLYYLYVYIYIYIYIKLNYFFFTT